MLGDIFKEWGECVKDGVATISCVPIVFSNIVNVLLMFAGLIALLMFIMGGFKFMTSQGDAKKVEGAKNIFVYGIIGLGIVLFSFLFISVLSAVTNVSCIKFFGFGCPIPTPTPLLSPK